MKLLVFSDSHGYADNMLRAIEKEKPALCFFLGDGADDLKKLAQRFPDLPVQAVRGNCDLRSAAPELLRLTVEGVRIFACHGHLYRVKSGYQTVCYAALEAEADLVLFGHTHIPYRDRAFGLELLNPGSVGQSSRPGWGLVTIDGGEFTTELKSL
jgi:putative phosphoesterase